MIPDPWEDGPLQVDEAGIVYARLDGVVMRARYRPVFGVCGEELRLVAVEGDAATYRDGSETHTGPSTPRLVALARALVLLNHGNVGIDRATIMVAADLLCPPREPRAVAGLEALLPGLADAGLHPDQIICMLDAADYDGERRMREVAADLRSLGLSVAIDGFAGTEADRALAASARPDVVRLDPDWFCQIAAAPPALRLLAQLAERMAAAGASILADGIDTDAQLVAALGAGAELLQGRLIGGTVRAGTPLAESPLPIRQAISSQARVIPLFRYRR